MRSSLTGALLAGPMLADLLGYLEAAATAATSNVVDPVYYKIVHLSAHYNTQARVGLPRGVRRSAARWPPARRARCAPRRRMPTGRRRPLCAVCILS